MRKNARFSEMLFYEDALKSVKLVRAVCRGDSASSNAALANRIFMSLLGQIDHEAHQAKKEYKVLFSDIESRSGVSLEYPAAVVCCKTMCSMVLGVSEGRRDTFYSVFSKITLEDGIISAVFNDEIIPFLENLGLTNPYIHYNLLEYLKLSSAYAQKLYELLVMFREQGNNHPYYQLTKLQNVLGIPQKVRARFQGTSRIIERARKEIQSKTPLRFAWEADKKYGPKHINFYLGSERLPKVAEQEKRKVEAEHEKALLLQRECISCFKQHSSGCPHYKKSRKSKCAICRRLGFFEDKTAPLFEN